MRGLGQAPVVAGQITTAGSPVSAEQPADLHTEGGVPIGTGDASLMPQTVTTTPVFDPVADEANYKARTPAFQVGPYGAYLGISMPWALVGTAVGVAAVGGLIGYALGRRRLRR